MFYRAVVDTNVLISSIINPHGKPAQVIQLILEGHIILISSPAVMAEVRRVFTYPHIQKILQKKARAKSLDINKMVDDLIIRLTNIAAIVEGTTQINVIEDDPSDNMFLVCAREGSADLIISGDKHLLVLGSFEEIPILTVGEFLSTCGLEGI